MIFFRFIAAAGVAAAAFAVRAKADEHNVWPAYVAHADAEGRVQAWSGLGPFLYSHPVAPAQRSWGFRPFYMKRVAAGGDTAEITVLYPLFYIRNYGPNYEWSIFKLINHFGRRAGESLRPATQEQDFDIWPFYFSSVTPAPETTYHALWPVAGTLQHRFGRDRISFVIWPLYLQTEKDGAITTSTPWPIYHATHGAAQGWALWPLYGVLDRPGAFHHEFYLWPLGYNNTTQPPPDSPPGTGPKRETGFLPFYTSERGPYVTSENYLYPFFGYTDRTAPFRDHVTRYFWPFLVQGRGDGRLIDRWGPFYTHSIIKGYDKTWVAWPLWRQGKWNEEGVAATKTQFFFFLYWGLEQRSLAHPAAAPARKLHVWPLLSYWDNGAGRQQYQFPSPLEVFFPHNDEVRESWTPLFSLYRHDQSAPGETRTSLLWDGITWERSAAHHRSEFHLGPLFGIERSPYERRVTLLGGLLGWSRRPGDGAWRTFGLEFSRNRRTLTSQSR
jgi:hypothetical protein